jgi:transposase
MSEWDTRRARDEATPRVLDEFEGDGIHLVVITGRPIAEVADELGIYDSTLRTRDHLGPP